jgi:hypothetical protein
MAACSRQTEPRLFVFFRIGTKCILGVLGLTGSPIEDNEAENSILPPNVTKIRASPASEPFGNDVYGDYEVCPLSKERPEYMQFVCIEKASNLLAKPN